MRLLRYSLIICAFSAFKSFAQDFWCDFASKTNTELSVYFEQKYGLIKDQIDSDSANLILSNHLTYVLCEFDLTGIQIIRIFSNDQTIKKEIQSLIATDAHVEFEEGVFGNILTCNSDIIMKTENPAPGYDFTFILFVATPSEEVDSEE